MTSSTNFDERLVHEGMLPCEPPDAVCNNRGFKIEQALCAVRGPVSEVWYSEIPTEGP